LERAHEQNEYRKNPKANFTLSAKRPKINWMSGNDLEEGVRL